MTLFTQNPKLTLGEKSAVYIDTTHTFLWHSPAELARIKNKRPLEIFIDFPGADYSTHQYPKLSFFEIKQAIGNHPTLQDPNIISASAFLSEKDELNLCVLRNTPTLEKWVKALIQQKIPIKSLKSLAFFQSLSHPKTNTKSTYWITKTHDQQVRHICLIKEAVAFVRYTNLDATTRSEIEKTLNFIQRDYALNRSQITLQNDLEKEPYHVVFPSKKIYHWDWIERFPKTLSLKLRTLTKAHAYQNIKRSARATSLALFALSAGIFLTKSIFYYRAQARHETYKQAYQQLPASLKELSFSQKQQILWISQNTQGPFHALSILQKQTSPLFKLEEFHWGATEQNEGQNQEQKGRQKGQRLRLAVKRHAQKDQQDTHNQLETLFKTTPQFLSSDIVVDRFDITLTPEALHDQNSNDQQ